jgi:hypothetical protein|eukprot:scaffold15465_cov200-Alexandrium_tamarense.AAC.2
MIVDADVFILLGNKGNFAAGDSIGLHRPYIQTLQGTSAASFVSVGSVGGRRLIGGRENRESFVDTTYFFPLHFVLTETVRDK